MARDATSGERGKWDHLPLIWTAWDVRLRVRVDEQQLLLLRIITVL